MSEWEKVGAIAPRDLEEARLQLHWATQLAASAGMALVREEPDDSHTALELIQDRTWLAGAATDTQLPRRVALSLPDLRLVVSDADLVEMASLPLAGKTLRGALEWLRDRLGGPEGRVTARAIAPPDDSLEAALQLLRRSKRPAIIVGHGARFQMERVLELAEAMTAPVLTTFKGKGLVSDRHPLGCGVLGRSGTPIASWFMNESDCLLVFGASFSSHTGITPKKPTIQVDFDPMMLGKFHAVDVPVWGEIGVTAALLLEGLATGASFENQTDEVAERWKIWRREKERRERDVSDDGLGSAAVFASLNRRVPADAIVAVDVGNNTYSFGRYFECAQQSVLMSGYLGSIGYALPAALGAWAATTETDSKLANRPVVSISGDGGFGQYMAELTTAVKYGMNITHVLLNNGELGKISKEQRSGNWDVWETSLVNPNFADYAELCGAVGVRVSRRDELDDALGRALDEDGPALVEILTDPLLV